MINPPSLELKRYYSFHAILVWAAEQKRKGRSLPADLEQLLEKNKHSLELSDPRLQFSLPFHPVLEYKKEWREKLHFLAHVKDINPIILYYSFGVELEDKHQGREIQLNREQLEQLQYSIEKLYYFHGNVGITGAPLVVGGITPLLFFQWGNLLGVIKYVVLAAEKSLVGNLLLYTEYMAEEELEEEAIINYLQREFGLTLSTNELLQQSTRVEPNDLPQLLHQYVNTVQIQKLQSETPIPSNWPPRPSLQQVRHSDRPDDE